MIRKRDDVPAEADPGVEDAAEALAEAEHDVPHNRLAEVDDDEPGPERDVEPPADEAEPLAEDVEPRAEDAPAEDGEAADDVRAEDEDEDGADEGPGDSSDAQASDAEVDGEPGDAEATAAEVADDLGPAADEDGEGEQPGGSGRPLTQRVEAILFAAAAPLAPAKLARVLDEPLDDIKLALEQLVEIWAERPGAIDLVAIAGGWRFMTRPEFQVDLAGMAKKGKIEKLSPAALETLAIVAYKQPLTRVEVEAIRGVAAGPLLRVLLDRDLIRVSGRSPEPGHPLLYGTTKRFLDHFGLDSLRSLPDIKDLLDVS